MTTPNEKVFMLFLEFETTSGKRITSVTMDQAIAYVLKNYKDSDIPTRDKLRELASRYIQIPGNRTRLVVSGPYGRKVANFEKPTPLTLEKKKETEEKKQREDAFFKSLKESAEKIEQQREFELTRSRELGRERERKNQEDCLLQRLSVEMGYDIPAPRPPYFVDPPSGEKLNDVCFVCRENLDLPVAFCRYCHSSIHLACYNEMTPEERKTLFTREGFSGYATTGLCNVCKNGYKPDEILRMKQLGSMDDATYFRWPSDTLFHPTSPAEKAKKYAASRELLEKQKREYEEAVAIDFPILSQDELNEARVNRQRQNIEQNKCTTPDVCAIYPHCRDDVVRRGEAAVAFSSFAPPPPPPALPVENFVCGECGNLIVTGSQNWQRRSVLDDRTLCGDCTFRLQNRLQRINRIITSRGNRYDSHLLENVFNEYNMYNPTDTITQQQFNRIIELLKKQGKSGGNKIYKKRSSVYKKRSSTSKKRSSTSKKRSSVYKKRSKSMKNKNK